MSPPTQRMFLALVIISSLVSVVHCWSIFMNESNKMADWVCGSWNFQINDIINCLLFKSYLNYSKTLLPQDRADRIDNICRRHIRVNCFNIENVGSFFLFDAHCLGWRWHLSLVLLNQIFVYNANLLPTLGWLFLCFNSNSFNSLMQQQVGRSQRIYQKCHLKLSH